ncbi:MAG: benzoyl-CoA oxygenase, partial [Roseovarius sp.]|nr:benzoyl-CoA oxygenase [Roseovarius sp.]
DRMLAERASVAAMLNDARTHVYICGLKGMEEGVDAAFTEIAGDAGLDWTATRDAMRDEGRYHVETY